MHDAKEALEMSSDDAEENLSRLECFLDALDERLDYFGSRGHVNPGKKLNQMMLSMLIMMIDKLAAEGLFKGSEWRKLEEFYYEEDDFPEGFPE